MELEWSWGVELELQWSWRGSGVGVGAEIPQLQVESVETDKTLATFAIKCDLCQQQQLKNYPRELYERMVVVLSHVR